ncbi:dockerin type I domain-containing protein [Blastopirellula marina]|nr:dockerin type I domain-containing protein [Blastopirellula marina]
MMASDLNAWHNPNMSLDVNGDSLVDQTDVSILISQLELGFRSYSVNSQTAGGLEGEQVLYLDVNNDGDFNPLDLSMMLSSLIEGEDAASDFSAGFTFEIYQNNVLLGTATTSFDASDNPVVTPINVDVEQGSAFTLKVYVRNSSTETGGALATPDVIGAYLDIGYDPSFVQPVDTGSVLSPFSQGGVAASIDPTGLVKNAGGSSTFGDTDPEVPGGWENNQMLYSIDFTPVQAGAFTLEGFKAVFTEDDGDPNTQDINQAAVVFQDLRNTEGSPLDVVNLAFPQINVNVLQRPGANNDIVAATADLIEEIDASDPRIVEIGGINYLVIDVKENDLDFDGNALTTGAEVTLTLESGYAATSLTTTTDLAGRVLIGTDPIAALPGLSDQYLLYQLPEDLSGTEEIIYTLTDPNDSARTNTATVTINITPVLVAVDDGDTTTPFATVVPGDSAILDVLANDYIAGDGTVIPVEDITIIAVSGQAATDGRLDFTDGKTIIYTASATPGLETFTYTIQYTDADDVVHTDEATVTVRVPIDSLIAGGLFFDVNNDGAWNEYPEAGNPEDFIGGVEISLYQGGVLVGTTQSSQADGTFGFAGIDEGTYSIKIAQPKFVYKFGTGVSSLPANWTVLADGSVMINNLTIAAAGTLKFEGLNLGYLGRTGAYRGINDQLATVGENTITFAVSKQADGSGKLEWYSPNLGWDELVFIDGFLFDTTTKTGQLILHIDEDGDSLTDPVIAPITFSLNNPHFLLIADTSDAVIFKLVGDIETIVDHLSSVDVAFSDF